MPDTTPDVLMVAVTVGVTDQVPPGVASLMDTFDPAQTLAVPVIAAGNGLTNTVVVTLQPVPSA